MSKEQKPAKPSILSQWKNRKQKTKSSVNIPLKPKDQSTPLSSGQKRLWLLQQLYPDNPFYQYGHLYRINGPLDKVLLIQSFQTVIDQHEILRSNFQSTENGVIISVKSEAPIFCKEIDLTKVPKSQQEIEAEKIKQAFVNKTFDLQKDLLIRICLIQFSETQFSLVLSIHHIIGDRTSLLILNEAVFKQYEVLQTKKQSTLSPLPIQYSDYSFWQNQQSTIPKDIDYWNKKLSGELPILSLPTDSKRPKKNTFKGEAITRNLSSTLSAKINRLAKEKGITPYVLLLATFKILLFRYTHQTDLLVGSPFSNRDKTDLEKLIGFFNETLVLRTQLLTEWSFDSLIKDLQKTTLEAFTHRNMPFDQLVKTLSPERHGSANPLFQVMFLYNKAASYSFEKLDISIEESVIDFKVSKFDLTLFVNERQDHLEMVMEFATDLFEENTIVRLLNHLENIIEAVVDNPTVVIKDIPLLDEAEKQKILFQWNDTHLEMPPYDSIHQLIEKVAQENPNGIAVVDESDEITYAELIRRSDLIAAMLLQANPLNEKPIGLYANRGINMIVGILGILKSGAAYLPLDPTYPIDRINYMVEDAEVELILSEAEIKSSLGSTKATIISIESALKQSPFSSKKSPSVNSQQNAYIIYTSGSTGRPKGVPISHQNLLHSTLARFSFYPSNPKSFLLLSSFAFDSSVVGIFWTLASGGKLVLPPARIEQDITRLSTLIEQHQVSHTLLLPSLYSMILLHAPKTKLHCLENIMVAGEACPLTLVDVHFSTLPNTQLYNEYGPTEASVWCIAHQIHEAEKQFIPIGKAIPNTEVYILDTDLKPVPIGVSGELYIGGKGLAKGYLNRPKLTSERFLPHPFSNGLIYKTGDLARFHADGLVEFLGRVDHQIKIRGFRVELEEIQAIMTSDPDINEALVIVHKKENSVNSNQQLIAYFSTKKVLEINTFRRELKDKLPSYMVPSILIPLKEFPRLPNGKINRKKLPSPNIQTLKKQDTFISPKGALEKQLAHIWESVLQIKSIGRFDNFFAIGGDSILSIQVVSKARKANIILAPNQLFEHQSIATLAASIQQNNKHSSPTRPVLLSKNPKQFKLSYLQQAFLFNSQKEQQDQGQLILEFKINGKINIPLFKQAWEKCAQQHDMLKAYINTSTEIPLQSIALDSSLHWSINDWSSLAEKEQNAALNTLRKVESEKKIDLSTPPTSRLSLNQLSAERYLLIWVCHHIFLDGWSCGIILKEVLQLYQSLLSQNELTVSESPNYFSYLNWAEQLDSKNSKIFWQKKLQHFDQPLIFKNKDGDAPIEINFNTKQLVFHPSESDLLLKYCQANQITLSTLFQGIWAILLGACFQTKDVLYGLTVTGRFVDFPNIESISGLFMSILPNRFSLDQEGSFTTWLKVIQKDQGLKSRHENFSLDDIQKAIQWPSHIPLFESLFVFGNFLKNKEKIGPLSLEYSQGGFTSNYPLTIHINPKKQIEIKWQYDTLRVDENLVTWFKDSFYQLTQNILNQQQDDSLQKLIQEMDVLTNVHLKTPTKLNSKRNKLSIQNYKGPQNQTEVDLIPIWQNLFNHYPIGIHDNYFSLGGNSLMAIQLFANIEKRIGKILPPSTLFKNPTIAQIAKLIRDGASSQKASTLVALRSNGDRPPLFCIHGGGGHVFFYQGLCKHLPEDQPVYSIQPPGIDGIQTKLKSVEAMATRYIQDIKQVQTKGPYYLLGTCFSNSVALEMAKQLEEQGEEIARLFIIDSAPVHLFGNDQNGKSKTFARFYDMLKRGDFSRIKSKLKRRLTNQQKETIAIKKTETASEKNLRLTVDSLNQVYADYHWKPFSGKIHFIRSSEFQKRRDKAYHLTQWNKLAKGGLEVHVVDGHHFTLFDEPEIQGLSLKIESIIY